jgi:hypothetical protein
VALVVLVAVIGFLLIGVLLGVARGSAIETERQKRNAQTLAKAKEALIAYAVAVQPDTLAKRPGDLPCPDLDNDGDAEATCSNASTRVGRLPWRTLGLSDLRDADGERLWYALSTNFRRSTVNQCEHPGDPACLNSETPGTITVRDASGVIVSDGTTLANNPSVVPSGAIAVIFAPGPVITRLGDAAPQDRSCAGDANVAGCEQSGICSSPATARCNPANYLDLANASVVPSLPGTEDNRNFVDATNTNGFIAGPVRDGSGQVVVNDTLLAVRYVDLMPKLEQRVAREALACLHNYANSNSGHYPWAAPVSADYTSDLLDTDGSYFGRLPQMLSATAHSGLSDQWMASSSSPACPISMSENKYKWWANWVNLVFFSVAPPYAPDSASPACGACLTVNPPSPAASRRVIVLVAGRPIIGESRGVGSSQVAYLEDANRDGSLTAIFKQGSPTSTFNDTVAYE